MTWTRGKLVLLAMLCVVLVTLRGLPVQLERIAQVDLPNPDSYYKLVMLEDHQPDRGFNFVERDNAPHGSWVHWSLPHSWTVWQLHHAFEAAGGEQSPALVRAGAAVTLVSLLLVVIFTAFAVARVGSGQAAIVSVLVLATSVPLLSYGRLDQITHHIFMLAPLAIAAYALLPLRETVDRLAGAAGGALLGLALWVSPETMPAVAGLVALHAIGRLQRLASTPVWPAAMALVGMVTIAWIVDPPPPTYDAWTLDHVSGTWLLFASLLAALLIAAEICARRDMSLRNAVLVLIPSAAVCAGVWLLSVPGALAGPTGLIPNELIDVWWNQIRELRPAETPPRLVAFLAMPLLAAAVAGWQAWRERCLWLAALAFFALVYGVLGAAHARMGAAASVVAALALGIAVSRLPAFRPSRAAQTSKQSLVGFMLTVAPVLQLIVVAALGVVYPTSSRTPSCSLAGVAERLNDLPAGTVLAPVFSGPEWLYRTHHRILAGPYHHNIEGLLDTYRSWLDTGGAISREVLQRRQVQYVAACVDMQPGLSGDDAHPTLMQRAVSGDVPPWLHPIELAPDGSQWRIYRVVLMLE